MVTKDLSSNCAVQAIARLFEMQTDEVVLRLNVHALLLGEASAFLDDGMCLTDVVHGYLTSRGWSRWKRQGPDYRMTGLPPTCLVQVPWHVFAMIDGFIWDGVALPLGSEVLGFWSPPDLRCGVGEEPKIERPDWKTTHVL